MMSTIDQHHLLVVHNLYSPLSSLLPPLTVRVTVIGDQQPYSHYFRSVEQIVELIVQPILLDGKDIDQIFLLANDY
jgi:hypothetical protein